MPTMKARFVQGDLGEEHEVNVLRMWEDEIIRIREAFCREMTHNPPKSESFL
jgi:hypothetical protein